ncbi:MAG: acetyl-CoA carboxylase biotin carboxylase subunit [Anaerolineae bacterium]|nr:acetyl-CoA carboxylase biotin carboxylase subunit [Anaerolineae bacterium]
MAAGRIRRVLIANRGEIAVRIVRACRELGIASVVTFSEADSGSLAVRMADQAALIGPPPPTESYLRADRILEAARATDCDAVHPGFGFLAENADFAQAVLDAGLIFIGPLPDAIRAMGVKTEALDRVRRAGVPTLPGYAGGGPDADYLDAARAMGYPVLVKAAAGGGGKGMRVVRAESELLPAIESARRESARAFADERVFLEKYVDAARHIEFQVMADHHGNTVHLFERECSVQRRHQKIIEETPSPYLDDGLRVRMGQAAVEAARAVDYRNAGTVEFIVDAATGQFYFLEMNTRLQVEHPITELATSIDLVKLQFRIAEGAPLPFAQDDLSQRGHAIECRVYAEDPANNFLPQPGDVLQAVEPWGPGVRVDSGVGAGDAITMYYDPMIAKLIVHAEDRAEALRRMDAALSEYVIIGPTTNIRFLRDVLAHPVFQAGEATTAFVERHFEGWTPPQDQDKPPDAALIAAALAEMLLAPAAQPANGSAGAGDQAGEMDRFSPWARADGFRIGG